MLTFIELSKEYKGKGRKKKKSRTPVTVIVIGPFL